MNQELINFCKEYNIPFNHLGSILADPKVIPMIRGKAFEFSVCDYLKELLDQEKWRVSKPFLNPQFNSHDEDVLVEHVKTGEKISIECKLSAKGGYRYHKTQKTSVIRVKCMRSRTLGVEMAKALAKIRNLDEKSLNIHNDQYLPGDFDLVITTLANAFYITDEDGSFVWGPTKEGQNFLEEKFGKGLTDQNYKDLAYRSMYVATSYDLAINPNSDKCTRKNCTSKDSCGFIPNYPLIKFDHEDLDSPRGSWKHISDIESVFLDIIQHRQQHRSLL